MNISLNIVVWNMDLCLDEYASNFYSVPKSSFVLLKVHGKFLLIVCSEPLFLNTKK